jgi:hypothetical protein
VPASDDPTTNHGKSTISINPKGGVRRSGVTHAPVASLRGEGGKRLHMIDLMCSNELIICHQPQQNYLNLINRFFVFSFQVANGFLLQQKERCI